MGVLIADYLSELEYLELFNLKVDSIYHDLVLFIYKEADKKEFTTTSLAAVLKTSKYEIHNWIRDPETLTMKDIVKLEILLDISLLNITK